VLQRLFSAALNFYKHGLAALDAGPEQL